jgi:hypothetical protein
MMKRPTMAAAFSPNVRSISLPPRSHPTTVRVEEELNKLKSWESSSSSSSKAETICVGLSLLSELYRRIEDLLNLPLTQQALSQDQHQKWVNELLEGSLRYLDACGNTRDSVLSMQETIRELQSALRRRKVGDSSVESVVSAYICSRRKMKKETAKSLASLKPMDGKFGDSGLMLDLDDHLLAVVRVLRETSLITISIFHALLLFLSMPVLKPKASRWSLVSKLVQKGALARKEKQENVDELEGVDMALGNLLMQSSSRDVEGQKIQSAQIRLDALDVSMEGLVKGLECLFRRLIQTRVFLLNIMSH